MPAGSELKQGLKVLTNDAGSDAAVDWQQLVNQARAGNKEALLELVLAREKEFFGLSFVYMRNQHDAADAMQDMIVTLYSQIHTLRQPQSFYSWAKQILVRCCLSRLRKSSREQALPEQPAASEDPSPETGLDLLNEVHCLPEPQRDVLLLFYYNDRTLEEISEIMSCPLGTVKSRLHQALKKLKGRLGDEYRE